MPEPSWYLRAGYAALALRNEADGATLVTTMARPTAAGYAPERQRYQTGAEADVARTRTVAVEVASWPDIVTLRAWAAAGAPVTGLLLARGRGRHLLWDEPVPVLLEPADALPGAFQAERLVLVTGAFDAAVTEDVDLLALAEWTDNGDGTESAERWLPLPGRTLYVVTGDAVALTLVALSRYGATLATASDVEGALSLALPAGTGAVRLTRPAGTDTVLTAHRPLGFGPRFDRYVDAAAAPGGDGLSAATAYDALSDL